jgi:hypothetical protein
MVKSPYPVDHVSHPLGRHEQNLLFLLNQYDIYIYEFIEITISINCTHILRLYFDMIEKSIYQLH